MGMLIFPTLGSYIITFIFAFISLLIGLGFQKFAKMPYWKVMISIGTAATVCNFILLPFTNLFAAGIIAGLALFTTGIYYGTGKILATKLRHPFINKISSIFSRENTYILGAHFLDAASSFISVAYFGYLEQHVLPRIVFPIFGPGIMFFLKLIVVVPALWLIDRYAEGGEFKALLKIVILILGLAPGLRNTIRLVVEV